MPVLNASQLQVRGEVEYLPSLTCLLRVSGVSGGSRAERWARGYRGEALALAVQKMDVPSAALKSIHALDQRGRGGPEMLYSKATGGEPVEVESCSGSLKMGAGVLACKEACGTSTIADSPPVTSPVVRVGGTLSASDGGAQGSEGKQIPRQIPAGETSEDDLESQQQHQQQHQQQQTQDQQQQQQQQGRQVPPPARAALVNDAQGEELLDALATAVATMAVESPNKSGKPSEYQEKSLLRRSGQVASKAWESARTHASAAVSVTASSVASTDFSTFREATAKPLLAAASYIGLGPFFGSSVASPPGDAPFDQAEPGAGSQCACEAEDSNIKWSKCGCAYAPVMDSEGPSSSKWLKGRLRLPAVTDWLCSPSGGCDGQLSCSLALADEETELEGSEAEAAAKQYMATVSGVSTASAGDARTGNLTTPPQHAPSSDLGGGSCCMPSTPKTSGILMECRLLDARNRAIAAAEDEGKGGCCTVMSAEAHNGVGPVLASFEKTADTAIACEHCLLPALGGQGGAMNEEDSKARAPAAADTLQQDQPQKQKLWASLSSTLGMSSSRPVGVVQHAATTVSSVAGAASRAIDGLVVPLFGSCMQPSTRERVGDELTKLNGEAFSGEGERKCDEPDSLKKDHGEECECEQTRQDHLTRETSQTSSRGLLTELQRRQQALAEAVRSRSTNFLQHSVALTASSTFSEARYHLAEIVDTGGPEVGSSGFNNLRNISSSELRCSAALLQIPKLWTFVLQGRSAGLHPCSFWDAVRSAG